MDFIGIPGSMGRLADGTAFFDRQEIMSRACPASIRHPGTRGPTA
jgi:hypothetical protein